MANAWFRMYAEFATDPKVQMLSEAYQRRLTMLLCLRCNGHVTLQDKQVTFLLRISNDEWQQTKAIFIECGFINSANEILNWDKRQFTSDSSKNRVASYRERKKQECNNDVTLHDRYCNAIDTEQIQNRTDTDTETHKAGRVCKEIVKIGLTDVNPAHPTFTALLEAGATDDEFIFAAQKAKQNGKGFAYAIGIVKKSREEAKDLNLHRGGIVKPMKGHGVISDSDFKEWLEPERIVENG